jgi:hypothetical protein
VISRREDITGDPLPVGQQCCLADADAGSDAGDGG